MILRISNRTPGKPDVLYRSEDGAAMLRAELRWRYRILVVPAIQKRQRLLSAASFEPEDWSAGALYAVCRLEADSDGTPRLSRMPDATATTPHEAVAIRDELIEAEIAMSWVVDGEAGEED